MERRTFLANVLVGAGAGAIWLPGCGAPGTPTLRAHEVNDLIGRLDRGVRAVREAPFGGGGRPWVERDAPTDRMARLGLEALVVADVARAIPAGTRLPNELAAHLQRALPVLDDCVVGYHAMLEETPRVVRRKIDRRFRAKPETAMDVAQVIDRNAGRIGISTQSRVKLRRVASLVGARVRRQSSSALIDDCAQKIENVVAHNGADLRAARSTTANALVAAIWHQVEQAGPAGGLSAPAGAPADRFDDTPARGGPSLPAYEEWERPPGSRDAPEDNPGDTELAVGGVMLGAGLAVFGIGGIITAVTNSPWPVIVAATPAGIAVIIGLIVLIVGGVQNATAE